MGSKNLALSAPLSDISYHCSSLFSEGSRAHQIKHLVLARRLSHKCTWSSFDSQMSDAAEPNSKNRHLVTGTVMGQLWARAGTEAWTQLPRMTTSSWDSRGR